MKLYPRKKLDIGWDDLLYGFFRFLLPTSHKRIVRKLEKIWQGHDRSLACLSVRTCLDLYLQVLNLPPKSEVIMSAMTIDDMVTIVQSHKLIVIPLDLDPNTLSANPEDLERLITPRTRMIIFAHLLGAQINLDPLIEVAKKHNIFFVEDCAQAYSGLKYKGNQNADISLFSFGIIKTATALGGSMATVRDTAILNSMKSIEEQYNSISSFWYLKRILKNSFLKILSNEYIFKLFASLCALCGKNYDVIISSSTKGFSSEALIQEIRQRPPSALLSVLYRRLRNYPKSRTVERETVGKNFTEKLPKSVKALGNAADKQTFWVFSVLHKNPKLLIDRLRKVGFDATAFGSSMHVIGTENPLAPWYPKKLVEAKKQLVYLPLYIELSHQEQIRMLETICNLDVENSSSSETKGMRPGFLYDKNRTNSAFAKNIISVISEEILRNALKLARSQGLKISIMGTRHNMGGHAFTSSGIILDMTKWNSVIDIDIHNKTITVQSGALWHDIQKTLNQFGLAITSMQSSSRFTVGGSLGSNIHGRDIRASLFVNSLISFRLMKADGNILRVSRTENAEFFGLAVGGYGLFGIVLDCTLSITENILYREKTNVVDHKNIVAYFQNEVSANPTADLFISDLSITHSQFLTKSIVTSWHNTGIRVENNSPLGEEKHVRRDKFLLNLARHYGWGKELCWQLEKILAKTHNGSLISRTNAMRPPAVPLAFLEHNSPDYAETVQEYFIPIRHFLSFLRDLKPLLTKFKGAVLDMSNRFISKNNETLLSYAPNEDALSVMIYMNERFDVSTQISRKKLIIDIVELVIRYGGTYYLTYHRDIPFELMKKCYPGIEKFLYAKELHDPENIFSSLFYERVINAKMSEKQ